MKKKKLQSADGSSFLNLDINQYLKSNDEELVKPITQKKKKTTEGLLPVEPPVNPSIGGDCSEKVCDPKLTALGMSRFYVF